jgi:hypothetical protein
MTKKELAQRVQSFCQTCMGRQSKRFCETRDCQLYPIRIMRTVKPDQYHAFRHGDPTDFHRAVIRAAWRLSGLGFFSFDAVRERAGIEPLSASWWGSATKRREWRQCFRSTGRLKVSSTKSRSGGAQRIWERKPEATEPFDGMESTQTPAARAV